MKVYNYDEEYVFSGSGARKSSVSLSRYLETGEHTTELRIGDNQYPLIQIARRELLCINESGKIVNLGFGNGDLFNCVEKFQDSVPDGVFGYTVNGDPIVLSFGEDNNAFQVALEEDIELDPIFYDFEEHFSSIFSILCLTRLVKEKIDIVLKDVLDVIEDICLGEIRVVDRTKDVYKTITQKISEQYRSGKLIVPVGTTLVSGNSALHSPATIVFWHMGKNKCYILGQDDDSYFGCLLSEDVNSVEEAYFSLAPIEARSQDGILPGVLRQGEWFAVPVDEKDVPDPIKNQLFVLEYNNDAEIVLPRDNDDSAQHTITCFEQGIIDRDGTICIQGGRIEHGRGEHPTLHLDDTTFYRFFCNTSKMSVSIQGMD